VAAHLEPEILIVDEVLAVGDAEFQKKCLGKMDEVSRSQGRTVLFVSHNMEAVLKLCTRGILFESGNIKTIGDINTVVPTYLSSQLSSPKTVDLSSRARPVHFGGKARLASVSSSAADGSWFIPFGQPLSLDVAIDAQSVADEFTLGIALHSIRGFEVASWTTRCNHTNFSLNPGINNFRIAFPQLRLLPGSYWLDISIWSDPADQDRVNEAVRFEVSPSPESAEINAHHFGGAIVPTATMLSLD